MILINTKADDRTWHLATLVILGLVVGMLGLFSAI
jgi:hypothetical protein